MLARAHCIFCEPLFLPRESNVGGVDGVGTVSVEIIPAIRIGAVDVDILQEDFARMYERHGPHLRLQEIETLDDRVGEASESDLMRPAWIVADAPEPVIPDLSITVEGSDTTAVDMYLIAAEDERGRLVLIAHRHGVLEPVRDIVAPKEGTLDVHLDVGEASDLHYRVDVI